MTTMLQFVIRMDTAAKAERAERRLDAMGARPGLILALREKRAALEALEAGDKATATKHLRECGKWLAHMNDAM